MLLELFSPLRVRYNRENREELGLEKGKVTRTMETPLAVVMDPIDLVETIDTIEAIEDIENSFTAENQKTAAHTTETKARPSTATTPTETPSSSADPEIGMGCYLTFESVSEGTLFLNWSESKIENAYAYFCPGKTVPKFKFKQNGGKSELIRGMRGGTGPGLKKYFAGWVQFVKMAREFNAKLIVMYNENVAMHYMDPEGHVHPLPFNQFMDSTIIDAVAAIAPGNSAFDGVSTMTTDFFAGTGNKEGSALVLK